MAYVPVQQLPTPAALPSLDQLPSSEPEDIHEAQEETSWKKYGLSIEEKSSSKYMGLAPITLFIWKVLFLPAMGFTYLSFCYTCRFTLVKVGGVMDPVSHLSLLKAGVTSVSIIFVSLSLLPLTALISALKGEEFFRSLSGNDQGVPLGVVNSISTPSYGVWDTLETFYRRQGSKYILGAFFASLVFLAISTLAPAVLSIQTALIDDDLKAFSVGAVLQNSVVNIGNSTSPVVDMASNAVINRSRDAGSVAWAEVSLGVNYSFISPIVGTEVYSVPAPVDLPIDSRAHWLSDVMVIRPSCEWIAPKILTKSLNITALRDTASPTAKLVMELPSKKVRAEQSFWFLHSSLQPLASDWSGQSVLGSVSNLTTTGDLSNGATIWLLIRAIAGARALDDTYAYVKSGASVPFSRYNGTDGGAFNISFLFCDPNVEIRTHHIQNDGKGSLEVGDRVSKAQGNLHAPQTRLLLSAVFYNFDRAGPQGPPSVLGLGNEAQLSQVFGKDTNWNTTGTITPQPIEKITMLYGRFLQSGLKDFIDGSLAIAYVPGRTTREIAVFTSSLPHIIVSTVLYIILTAFMLVCYFRKHVHQFTFFAVASSLTESNIPSLFAGMRAAEGGSDAEYRAISALRDAHLRLNEEVDGCQVLKLVDEP